MKSLSKRFFTTQRVSQPTRTTDSLRTLTSRDTLLLTPSPSEMAEWSRRMATMSGCDLGRLWVGDLTEKFDAIKATDPAKFADAVTTVMGALADYSLGNDLGTSEASSGPAGSLAFHGGVKPEFSKASVGDSGGAQMRRWRDQTSNVVASLNAKNAAFWEKQLAHQKR
jgi:hypothetical protein